MKKEKIKYTGWSFHNRWKATKTFRNDKWLVFGLYTWWASPTALYYKLGLFGFDILFRFERVSNENAT